jgi:phage terminase large subunit
VPPVRIEVKPGVSIVAAMSALAVPATGGVSVARYHPSGAARAVMECRAKEVLLAGPAGTGKSRAALEKLHAMCLMNPGMRALIVRKTQRSLATSALDTWRKFVARETLAAREVTWYGGSTAEPPQYRFRTSGATVMVGGMDDPTKIMSTEYDLIYVQEATELTITDWESLTTRLRNWKVSFQQLIADCNPQAETHWLKQRCNGGATVMLESRHRDNPVLYDDDGQITDLGREYMATLDALTGVRRLRLRDGLWAAAEGLVYEGWDPAVHVVDRFEPPAEWPRTWSIDFGHTNPFVCQCWVTDPDGRLILEWEVYRTGRLVEDHVETLARWCMRDPVKPSPADPWSGGWVRPRPRAVVCDHDAEGRGTFTRHMGLGTKPADKSVKKGIEAVAVRLRAAGDGRPRLTLMRDAVIERDPGLKSLALPQCTEEEWPGYVWATTKDGVKEDPVKLHDHGMDAARYRVMEADRGGTPRVRWM